MSKDKKLGQLSFDSQMIRILQESKNAQNQYYRPRNNMGVLHRRNK